MLVGQAQLEYMILEAMEKLAPDVVNAYLNKSDLDFESDWWAYKETLLQELMDTRGPSALLELAEYFPQNSLSSPLIYVLLNSPDPKCMLEKIVNYDRHFSPSMCHLVLSESGENYLVAEKVANTPVTQPSIASELFICGAIKALLELLGCENVAVSWISVRSKQLKQVLMSLDIKSVFLAENTRWRFNWTRYKRKEQIAGLDDFLTRNAEPFTISNKISVTHKVEELLTKDLTLRPTMQEVAAKLGLSVRTFQRKLREEGVTYSRIYNNLRIKTASRLLRQTTTSLTEIGFICGFSDSAHFSREFKKIQRMTPIAYRETHQMKKSR